MTIGMVTAVEGVPDCYYVDTGMYGTSEYGAVYLLDTDRPALIESGIGTHSDRILEAMSSLGIDRNELEIIALTHVHLDHAGGASSLIDSCQNATVLVHKIGAPHLIDPTRLIEGTKTAVGEQWQYYTKPDPIPDSRVRSIDDGASISLGDRTLQVHHVPGHAPHQVVYHDPDTYTVFTADAAGIWVPSINSLQPTSPPPNFDLEQCLDDIETIRELSPSTLCYPHFGPATPAESIAHYGSVLTTWVETVETTYQNNDDIGSTIDELAKTVEAASVWGPEKTWYETAVNVRGVLNYLDIQEE